MQAAIEDLCRRVETAAGVPPRHVILKVTESVYLGERDHVVADEIKVLRSMGFAARSTISEPSLTHHCAGNIIKIDKSFVDRLVPADAGTVFVEGVMSIATKLGIRVVAESIETQAQADHLRSLGCLSARVISFPRRSTR